MSDERSDDRCRFVVGHQGGEPVKCGAIAAIHGDGLGMAAHPFVGDTSLREALGETIYDQVNCNGDRVAMEECDLAAVAVLAFLDQQDRNANEQALYEAVAMLKESLYGFLVHWTNGTRASLGDREEAFAAIAKGEAAQFATHAAEAGEG